MKTTVRPNLVVRAGTDVLPELRILSINEAGVIFAVDGTAHRMGWDLLAGWAGVRPGSWTGATSDVTAAYRSVFDAADKIRRARTSTHERRRRTIFDLVAEGRRARDIGDVVSEGEIARTLDGLIGRWVGGVWIGGQAAILGKWDAPEVSEDSDEVAD